MSHPETGVLTEDVAFVYPRRDIGAIASRIMEASLMDEDESERLRKKARKWLERFTWERHLIELEKVLMGTLTNS